MYYVAEQVRSRTSTWVERAVSTQFTDITTRIHRMRVNIMRALSPGLYNELYRHDGPFLWTPVYRAKRELQQETREREL